LRQQGPLRRTVVGLFAVGSVHPRSARGGVAEVRISGPVCGPVVPGPLKAHRRTCNSLRTLESLRTLWAVWADRTRGTLWSFQPRSEERRVGTGGRSQRLPRQQSNKRHTRIGLLRVYRDT